MTDKERYAGMTVNERLFTAGLLDRFDAAFRDRDRATLVELLAQVGLDADQAKFTIDTIFARPKLYGRIR